MNLSRLRLHFLHWLAFGCAAIVIIFVVALSSLEASPPFQFGSTPTRFFYLPLVSKANVDSFTLIDWDLGAGAITLDQASEYKVYALFGSSLLPSRYQSDIPIPMEGTDSLIFALQDWNELNA